MQQQELAAGTLLLAVGGIQVVLVEVGVLVIKLPLLVNWDGVPLENKSLVDSMYQVSEVYLFSILQIMTNLAAQRNMYLLSCIL